MKKIYIGILVVVVIAIAIIGFFVLKPAQNSNTVANSQPIKIGIYAYPGWATFYIAQEKGFFKKYGLNVDVEQIPLDNELPALASGEIQMLGGTSDMMPILADAGIPAKQVFVTSKSNGADGLAVSNDIKR